MIDGVIIEPLKQIEDERGKVMHMLRNDSSLYEAFGEIYFSVVNPSVAKAWKKHLRMTQNMTVPSGVVKFVIYDDREGSPTEGKIFEAVLGDNNYSLIRIPPNVWYGFRCQSDTAAIIANCSDMPHDPTEVVRIDCDDGDVPYRW